MRLTGLETSEGIFYDLAPYQVEVEEFDRAGQGGSVPWIRVIYVTDGEVYEFNLAHVIRLVYQQGGQAA